jgi:hypothetical protein
MSATETAKLMLDALRPNQTPTEWESDRIRLGVDWDDLAVRAIVFGLAPQLHRRLTEWGAASAGAAVVPPRPAAKLAVTYQANAKRNEAIYTQLGEVLAACNKNGLRPIALKGVHLAAAVYADPALRPMNDIDLLFTADELPAAEMLLESLDYGGKHKSAELGAGVTKHTSTFQRLLQDPSGFQNPKGLVANSTPNPYLSSNADRMIEPHLSLEESWFGLKVDITPGVRERAVETTLGGQPCRVLAQEDLLLHLCVHFCFHLIMGAPSMVQLADLLAVTQPPHSHTPTQPLNWPAFVKRAIECNAAPYALAALTLAQKLLSAPVPDAAFVALSSATPEPLRRRISALGLPDILKRTQQKPLTSVAGRIRRGLADRAETARWAADWKGRWQVWQTALNIANTDTGQMLLGRKLKS